MARSLENQLAFTGGELSPLMDSRVDHPKYSVGCRQLQNMIAIKHGGATRRPGTVFKAKSKYEDTDTWQYAARLMPFQYSPTTSFILEFGHQYIRFYSNQQQVSVSSAPAWVNGGYYPQGSYVEDPSDFNNIYFSTALSTGLQPPPSANPTQWVKQSIYEVPSPYNGRVLIGPSIFDCEVWRLTPCQINDVVYLVHEDYPPYKLVRHGDTDWRLSVVDFFTPALLDQNATGVLLATSATTGNISIAASAPAWTTATAYSVGRSVTDSGVIYTCIVSHVSGLFATDLQNGKWRVETIFTSGNIGGVFQIGQIRNTSSITQALTANGTSGNIVAEGDCEFNTYGSWAATVDLERSDDGGGTWTKVRTINSESDHNGSIAIKVPQPALFRMVVSNYSASSGSPRAMFTIVEGISYGLVRITSVAGPYSANGTVIEELYSTASTTIWSEGAWSIRRGYPKAVTAFQQRLIYGGSEYEPQRIWGSVTDDLENFDLGDQSEATDSFAFDMAAVGRGRIQWLIGQVDLFVGFAGAEWIVNAGQGSFGGSNEPLTAQQINAGEHSAWGSANGVLPALVGNSVLYPQRAARTIQQMTFSVYTNKYQSADMTSLSDHLFGSGIVQLAYQPQFRNQNIVWVTTKGGSLCGMTYDMQSEVYAWHRHITGYNPDNDTIQFFESVACIDGEAEEDDQVWVVVDRPSGRCIELVAPANWETSGVPSKGVPQPYSPGAIYVDSSITVQDPPSNVIGGLIHLKGRGVNYLYNGNQSFGPVEVSEAGEIVLDWYDPSMGGVFQIGLPIYYSVQSMRQDVVSGGIIQGITRALSRVYVRLFNSLGGKVQGDGGIAVPIQYRANSLPADQGPPLFTGQKDVTPSSSVGYDPTMTISGSDCLPLTVLATVSRLGVTGSP